MDAPEWMLTFESAGALYVIGDVHGEAEALVALVDGLPLQPEDVIIQLGDCVGRGPHSFAVVEYWLAFDRCRRFVLQGNHEEMFAAYLRRDNRAMLSFGGEATVRSYTSHGWRPVAGVPGSVPRSHLLFLERAYPWTALMLRTPEYIFAHAGYDLGREPEEQSAETLVWGGVIGQEGSRTSQAVIRGHFPYPEVTITDEGWIGVDTGCGLGGPLSCLRLPDRKLFTARPASYREGWWRMGA